MEDRIIGRKDIVELFRKMYGITTWKGAKRNISRNHLPMRHTPSGRPMFITSELVEYDEAFLRHIEQDSTP